MKLIAISSWNSGIDFGEFLINWFNIKITLTYKGDKIESNWSMITNKVILLFYLKLLQINYITID